jgi:hypothetical protein
MRQKQAIGKQSERALRQSGCGLGRKRMKHSAFWRLCGAGQ